MPYRQILQPVSTTASGRTALALAMRIAKDFGAHLNAVMVRLDAHDATPFAGEGMSRVMIEDMIAAAEAGDRERGAEAAVLFETLRHNYGLKLAGSEPVPGEASASLSTVRGSGEVVVAALARLADLTILPHPGEDEGVEAQDCLHAVLFDSGHPVLIAPNEAPDRIGARCCLAWNGTVEAAAALAAMLPWLQRAGAVRILHAEDYQRRGPHAADLLPYLRLHGVEADIAGFAPLNRDVGAGMLAAAQEFDADLLGMGAYSHSRLRQMILGGVTRHVLGCAPMAVLMSR
jgi:nucleotide-binding universal stress UspA family protein